MSAVFCEEFSGKNRTVYIDVTHKDVNRFRKGSFHGSVQPGKQSSRSKLSREITTEPIAVCVQTTCTKTLTKK